MWMDATLSCLPFAPATELFSNSVPFFLQPRYTNGYGRPTGSGGTVTWSHVLDTGKVCVRMKAAKGGGLVTAFMVDSFMPGHEIDDELDMEIVGGDHFHWQRSVFLARDLLRLSANPFLLCTTATTSRKTTAITVPRVATTLRVASSTNTVSVVQGAHLPLGPRDRTQNTAAYVLLSLAPFQA